MAIKAGLVGVNPKGVDKNGMPIGSGGGSVDAYTKAETDTLLNGKVSNSQLTANNKAFHFAYDATSEKYGYKLDGTGDFIPFDNGSGIMEILNECGIVKATAGDSFTEGGTTRTIAKDCFLYWWKNSSNIMVGVIATASDAVTGISLGENTVQGTTDKYYYKIGGNTGGVSRTVGGITENADATKAMEENSSYSLIPRLALLLLN